MRFPTRSDYIASIQAPNCIVDPHLKNGKAVSKNGKLLSYSGGFAIVFPFEVQHKKYAIKCWVNDVGDTQKRTKEIASYLKQVNLPYFVEFEYLEKGLLSGTGVQPVVRMEWVEGLTLKEYVHRNLSNEVKIKGIATAFAKMVQQLHGAQIAHGDLQHENILIDPNGNLVLVDYDSLYVPSLTGERDIIKGLPGYQHPGRLKCEFINAKLDYFSELIIYLSLLAVANKPDLWSKYNLEKTEYLLFSKEDILSKGNTEVFKELNTLSREIKKLNQELIHYTQLDDIDSFLPLEDLIDRSSKFPWEGRQRIVTPDTPVNQVKIGDILQKAGNGKKKGSKR